MNEEERASQISALFDGELEASQSELVLRRILKDPGLRTTWGRYAVIGASLRHEPLSVAALGREDVATRVTAALAAEPDFTGTQAVSVHARGGWGGPVSKAIWGSALAAGVAAASILVLRMQALPPGAAIPMAANVPVSAAPVQPAVAVPVAVTGPRVEQVVDAAPSYTTPTVVNGNNAGLPAPLVNYVVAHSEYLTPVMRFNPLSAVMSSFEGDQLVEATEAEIGAARR